MISFQYAFLISRSRRNSFRRKTAKNSGQLAVILASCHAKFRISAKNERPLAVILMEEQRKQQEIAI